MIAPMGYETLRQAVDGIIAAYEQRKGTIAISRDTAIERLRALGFTAGDAVRWLRPERRGRP